MSCVQISLPQRPGCLNSLSVLTLPTWGVQEEGLGRGDRILCSAQALCKLRPCKLQAGNRFGRQSPLHGVVLVLFQSAGFSSPSFFRGRFRLSPLYPAVTAPPPLCCSSAFCLSGDPGNPLLHLTASYSTGGNVVGHRHSKNINKHHPKHERTRSVSAEVSAGQTYAFCHEGCFNQNLHPSLNQ